MRGSKAVTSDKSMLRCCAETRIEWAWEAAELREAEGAARKEVMVVWKILRAITLARRDKRGDESNRLACERNRLSLVRTRPSVKP